MRPTTAAIALLLSIAAASAVAPSEDVAADACAMVVGFTACAPTCAEAMATMAAWLEANTPPASETAVAGCPDA